MIDRRAFLAGGVALAAAGCNKYELGGPSTSMPSVTPGFRPPPDSDEAGMWLVSDRAEAEIKTAGNRIRDPSINRLVADCLCRLAGNHCQHLRPYVLRTAFFNASAMPNGMIEVWSGLLLRMEDDSQLAMILGHEFAHFLRRHTVQRLRKTRDNADMMAILNMGMVAMGARPGSTDLSAMIGKYQVTAFTRDNEREADELGFTMAVEAGYAPRAGARVWKQIIEERKAGGEEEEEFDIFHTTHPMDDERAKALDALADKYARNKVTAPDRLRDALRPVRPMLLADEVNLGHFKRSNWLFDRMLKDDSAPGDILYAKGELYRRRAKEGDEDMALGLYHRACEAKGAPPDAFRMVGLTRWRRGQKDMAREYFRRYLDAAPDARDRDMIRSYLAGA